MAMLKLYEWDDVYEELQKERIEKAICELERIICRELDIDLGDEILKPLDDWSGLRNIINKR